MHYTLVNDPTDFTKGVKIFAGLSPPVAFGLGLRVMAGLSVYIDV